MNFAEFLRVLFRYYPRCAFFRADARLLLSYWGRNPFRISKKFLLERGEEDPYTYGETPLTTFELIARRCRLSAADTVFELGCGRGRGCFWLRLFAGCSVVGVEQVPEFVEKAEKVRRRCGLEGISFRLEDLFLSDLAGATAIYLYAICFSDEQIERLIDRFAQLPAGTKIITVSYALTDYRAWAPFRLVDAFCAPFTWGMAELYVQLKV